MSESETESTPTVVLVHGAFADASSWGGVINQLRTDGIAVVAPANPLRGPTTDAAYIASVANQIDGPVLLVGHSYGGTVISGAAQMAENVVGMAFVAAFAPAAGESILDISGRFADSKLGAALRPSSFPVAGSETPGTEMSIDPAMFSEVFCADLPAPIAAEMALSQRPVALDGLTAGSAGDAWTSLPTWFAIAASDQAINPDAQRFMAERSESVTIEIDGSHAMAASQPAAVAAFLRSATESFSVTPV